MLAILRLLRRLPLIDNLSILLRSRQSASVGPGLDENGFGDARRAILVHDEQHPVSRNKDTSVVGETDFVQVR